MLLEMKQFSQLMDRLNLNLPRRTADGVCILTQGQDHWGIAYMTYVLAKQANLTLDFSYCEQELPDSPLYLLPSVTNLTMSKYSYDRLKQGFSPGEGDAAPGAFLVGGVFFYRLHDLFHRQGLADQFQRHGGTGLDADLAGQAFGVIQPMHACGKIMHLLLADLLAFSAVHTQTALVGQLHLRPLGFRIMTPDAGKGASLKENRGTYPRTIVDAKPLYVKYGTCFAHFNLHFRLMVHANFLHAGYGTAIPAAHPVPNR